MSHYFPEDAYQHFQTSDPALAELIEKIGPVKFSPGGDLFDSLVTSIVSQVISTAAAETVIRRLRSRAGDVFLPEQLADIPQEAYREMGIGAQKFGYITHCARVFRDEPGRFANVEELTDSEILKELCSLKGVGKWTAQMILIFNLGRKDVFAEDDLALRNAMKDICGVPEDIKARDLAARAEKWAPYRTAASIYLWNSIRRWE